MKKLFVLILVLVWPAHAFAYEWGSSYDQGDLKLKKNKLQFAETTTPSNPPSDNIKIYAKDSAGTTKVYTLDSAGSETEIGAGAGGVLTGLTGDSGGTTTGATVTLAGAGTVTTTRSGDSITITGSAGGTPSCPSVVKSGDYTLTGSDCSVIFDTSGGTMTATLPTAVGFSSFYNVKRSGGSNLSIATTSAQTIDGDASETLIVDKTSLQLVSDGSNWRIV